MLVQLWHWLVTSRYTRALESEVARLRSENRALVDSILGVAGIPPLKLDLAAQHPWAKGSRPDATGKAPQPPAPLSVSAAPIRRRSWQQIGRMLEMEAARRKGSDK